MAAQFGVFYHIPYNLGTPVFTVYKHADMAEWQAERRPVNTYLQISPDPQTKN